jgi:hypothetical protein
MSVRESALPDKSDVAKRNDYEKEGEKLIFKKNKNNKNNKAIKFLRK